MTSRQRWKRREAETAAILGTKRIPSAPSMFDILAESKGRPLAVEHKSRETIPNWLRDAVGQAVRNSPPEATPVVIVTAGQGPGRRLARLAILRLSDFVDLVPPDTAQALESPS